MVIFLELGLVDVKLSLAVEAYLDKKVHLKKREEGSPVLNTQSA